MGASSWISIQNAITVKLSEACAEIDTWLCRLLAPGQRDFSLGALIGEPGYPEDDLDYLEQEEAWGLD